MHDTRMPRKESRNSKTGCERRKLDIKPGNTRRLQGVVDMGYRERRILSRCKPKMDLDDQHRGRIREREEEEETTAMQDADPGGEMTAEVGTTSEAMNVEMVDLWEDVVDTQQEQEVLKHVAEIFVGSEADDDGESGWAWDDVHGKCLDLSEVREA